jgi:ER membrane protein complex subunit 1
MDARRQRHGVMLSLLLFFFGLLVSVSALHADEVGVVDWHHKLIGTPRKEATFLHKPLATSGALAFTLTDRNVLAALNLRDGSIGMPFLIATLIASMATASGRSKGCKTTRWM